MSKKKYDKTTIVVVGICIVLLFGWNYIFGPGGLNWMPEAKEQPKAEKQVDKKGDITSQPKQIDNTVQKNSQHQAVSKTVAQKSSSDKILPANKKFTQSYSTEDWNNKYPNVVLTSPDTLYTLNINPVKGQIESVKLNKIYNSNDPKSVILEHAVDPGSLSVSQPNDEWKLQDVLAPKKTNDSLAVSRKFSNEAGQSFTLKQEWTLGKDYSTNYSVTIVNNSSDMLNFRELYFWIGAIPPVEYISGDYARMESHRLDALLASNNELYSVKAGSSDFLNDPIQYEPIKWVAVSDMYFAYILKGISPNTIDGGNYDYCYKGSVVNKGDKKEYDVIGAAARDQSISIKPDAQQTWDFGFYAGPKDINLLGAFAPGAEDTLHLMTWPVMKTIAKWFLYALIYLKDLVGSFGWAIVLLTIIVKLVFWPITHKSNKSMKKMQKIQPMVKELREQYKDDKQMLNQKTMELYKKEKVNPLGGCLPIVVQIPVFIALYYTLMGAFEIRHASFLWATDLTKPDTIGHIFGLAINPFAILMAITMLLQQKMTPTATDPAQAKMMMLMPLVMLIFLYSLPSGLTLYWTVSQIITIAQLLYNQYVDKGESPKTIKA